MSRFQTLLQREWMQHHRGWLILMCAPPVLGIVALLFVDALNIRPQIPMALMLGSTLAGSFIVLGLTWVAVLFQTPGLARRDQQDRSIEFWLSLPVSHASSVGATLLMHIVAIPLLALVVGYAFSQVLGVVLVTRTGGIGALAGLNWAVVIPTSIALLLRGVLGVLLATLWVMPLLLLPMVASAWLKRWGVPVLVIALAVGHAILGKLYGITWIAETLEGLGQGAFHSLVFDAPPSWGQGPGSGAALWANAWPVTPGWLAGDALSSVLALAQPLFAVSLVISAACFGLLVLRRSQAG